MLHLLLVMIVHSSLLLLRCCSLLSVGPHCGLSLHLVLELDATHAPLVVHSPQFLHCTGLFEPPASQHKQRGHESERCSGQKGHTGLCHCNIPGFGLSARCAHRWLVLCHLHDAGNVDRSSGRRESRCVESRRNPVLRWLLAIGQAVLVVIIPHMLVLLGMGLQLGRVGQENAEQRDGTAPRLQLARVAACCG